MIPFAVPMGGADYPGVAGGVEEHGLLGVPPDQRAALESLREWIETRTGLHFGDNKQANLYRRLANLCWRLGIPDVKALELHMWANDMPSLPSEIAYAVSTSHSFFFREPEVLEFFRGDILPSLPAHESWRIWSAAAASGEEAFTLAVILSEELGPVPAQMKATILGTDISYPMIANAERGEYNNQRLELVPEALRQRHFVKKGADTWRVSPALASMCTFRRMNLKSHPWPFQNGFHVIFCRNVLYYFDRPHQEQLIERIYEAALPDSWLITSVTETLHGMSTRWRRITAGVYRKVEARRG